MPERKSFLLRIDPALWSELESWSAHELRSINAQIEFLLRQAVQKRKGKEIPAGSPPTATSAPVQPANSKQSR